MTMQKTKSVPVVAGLALAGTMIAMAVLAAEPAKAVRNVGNSAFVSQDGDPVNLREKIEILPGYTRIEQHSDHSHVVVVQRSGSAAGSPDALTADMLEEFPPALRTMFGPVPNPR